MNTKELLALPPLDWRAAVDRLSPSERDALRREAESAALHAAMFATYLDERAGHGCGDAGHERAMREANRTGRTLWCKAFGYNGFIELTC